MFNFQTWCRDTVQVQGNSKLYKELAHIIVRQKQSNMQTIEISCIPTSKSNLAARLADFIRDFCHIRGGGYTCKGECAFAEFCSEFDYECWWALSATGWKDAASVSGSSRVCSYAESQFCVTAVELSSSGVAPLRWLRPVLLFASVNVPRSAECQSGTLCAVACMRCSDIIELSINRHVWDLHLTRTNGVS